MSYIRITNNGYEYFNNDHNFLFSENNMHNYLFEYIAKDLSCLSKFFEQYISQRMNITTFEIKKHTNSANDIKKIRETLTSTHPFYEHEYQKVIIKAIGDFFNQLLVFSIANQNSYVPNITDIKEWYFDRLTKIMPSSLIKNGYYPDNLYPHDFFQKFLKWMDVKDYDNREIEDSLILNVPRKTPTGFSNEIQTHTTICNMLYFILDSLTPNMENLTIPQRIWLYDNIFYGTYSHAIFNVKKLFSLHSPNLYRKNQETENHHGYNNDFSSLYALNNLNVEHSGIPASMTDALNSAINYAKTISATGISEEYEIDDLHQLLYLEILYMIQANTVIKKCKNCGKYFVVTNQKISYCNRFDTNGVLCSDIGSKNTFQRKLENDPALESYNRAYKTHFARMKKGKIGKEELEEWRSTAKEKLELVRTGKLELSIYQKWLKK